MLTVVCAEQAVRCLRASELELRGVGQPPRACLAYCCQMARCFAASALAMPAKTSPNVNILPAPGWFRIPSFVPNVGP